MKITPEKLVESQVVSWYLCKNWDMSIIDSKGQFSRAAGCYKQSKAAPIGFPDSVGDTDNGEPAYVEFKAHKKRSTASEEQLTFLIKKIIRGAFGCVIDSVDNLQKTYSLWQESGKDPVILLLALPQRQLVLKLLHKGEDIPNSKDWMDKVEKIVENLEQSSQ